MAGQSARHAAQLNLSQRNGTVAGHLLSHILIRLGHYLGHGRLLSRVWLEPLAWWTFRTVSCGCVISKGGLDRGSLGTVCAVTRQILLPITSLPPAPGPGSGWRSALCQGHVRGEGSFLRNHELSSHKRPLQRRGQFCDPSRAGAGGKVPVQHLCSGEGVRIAEWAVLIDTRLMDD